MHVMSEPMVGNTPGFLLTFCELSMLSFISKKEGSFAPRLQLELYREKKKKEPKLYKSRKAKFN